MLGRLRFVYDARNEAGGTTYKTEYRYDALGRMIEQIDANQHGTRFEYDDLGRRTATIRPMGQETTTHYDALGRTDWTENDRGQRIHYNYDPNNDRLLTKDLPTGESDVLYTYYNDGQIHTVTDARGTTSYQYNDPQGRLTKRTDPDGAMIEYTYDLVGNISSVKTTTPGNSPHLVSYEYDAQNRLTAVRDGADTTRYRYDSRGLHYRTEYPNGVVEDIALDADLGWINGVSHKLGSTTLAAWSYTRDDMGNITDVGENTGRNTHYDYDDLYRLRREVAVDSVLGNLGIDYELDDVGNREYKIDHIASQTTHYDYNANDQLETETLGAQHITYAYDADGNTISKTTTLSGVVIDEILYRWSSENRLIGLDTNADGVDDVSYQYDESGIRISKTEQGLQTRYLIDHQQPYAQVLDEYQSTGPSTSTLIVSYTYGNSLISQDRASSTSYYHQDAHSGVPLLTDSSGLATDRYAFDAFGNLLHSSGSTSNSYLYRAEQFDASLHQYYNRARYYDQSVGRFSAVDPLESAVGDLRNLNRYVYSFAAPISNLDPSGLESLGSMMGSMSVGNSIQSFKIEADQAVFFSVKATAQGVAAGLSGGQIIVGLLTESLLEQAIGGVLKRAVGLLGKLWDSGFTISVTPNRSATIANPRNMALPVFPWRLDYGLSSSLPQKNRMRER